MVYIDIKYGMPIRTVGDGGFGRLESASYSLNGD